MVNRVREAIRTAEINHSEVARNIGIEPSKLSKSLAGTRNFRVEEISGIASLTNVSTDWLTTGRTVRPPRRKMVPSSPAEGSNDQNLAGHPSQEETSFGAEGPVPAAPGHDQSPSRSANWVPKGKRNQRRIIAAAWELYADRGIDNVRTEDVATACDLSASTINYHFRTKAQLLQAALRYTLDILSSTRGLIDPDDPLSTLRQFAQVHAGVDDKIRRVWSIWVQSWSRAAVDETARANLTDVYAEWFDLFASVVLAGQRAGTIRAGDTILMAKGLSIFIDGLGVARSTGQMGVTDDEARQMLDDYLTAHIIADPQERTTTHTML
nr:TetR family transcriptional regulator [Brevibacterium marinum]